MKLCNYKIGFRKYVILEHKSVLIAMKRKLAKLN